MQRARYMRSYSSMQGGGAEIDSAPGSKPTSLPAPGSTKTCKSINIKININFSYNKGKQLIHEEDVSRV